MNKKQLENELDLYIDVFGIVSDQKEHLMEALQLLLLSADASWEERNEGHDWALACQFAREIIKKTQDIDKELISVGQKDNDSV